VRKLFSIAVALFLATAFVPAVSLSHISSAWAEVPGTYNGVGQLPPMGWDDWNAFACNNDATDVEANAQYIHDSGLQADGYKYVINDGCWNDLVGVDPTQYPSGSATPAQPDPGGGPQVKLPTTAEETACGVSTSGPNAGRGTGAPGGVPAGQIFINPYLFPPSSACANDGLKIVANYVHSLGLKFGLWLDASNNWNGEEIPGSFGPCAAPSESCYDPSTGQNDLATYDQEDADTFASWGVNYVKADWSGDVKPPSNDISGGPTFDSQPQFEAAPYNYTAESQQMHEGIAQTMYGALSQALGHASQTFNDPILLNLCVHDSQALAQTWGAGWSWTQPNGQAAQAGANTWKSDLNLGDSFSSMVGMVNDVAQYAQYAGPSSASSATNNMYGYNDPDMLEVGVNPSGSGGAAPGSGMTPTEDQAQFSLFAEMAAPLIMGANMASAADVTSAENYTLNNTNLGIQSELPPASSAQDSYDLSILGNKDVIAVDQDPLGRQGSIVSFDGTHMILAKPLANGDVSVVLFNEGGSPAFMSTTAGSVGLPSATAYTLRDLWSGSSTESAGSFGAWVQPHQAIMWRISTSKDWNSSPQQVTVVPSISANPVDASGTTTVQVTVTNNGQAAATHLDVGLTLPDGWTDRETVAPANGALPSGDSATATFQVTAPASTSPISFTTFTATGGYQWRGISETVQSGLPVTLESPVSGFSTADRTSGPAADFGELNGAFEIYAAGTGVTAPGFRPGSDQYAAIYQPSGADSSAVATVEVTSVASGRGPEAGLIMRNDATGATGPEGVVLYVNGAGKAVMAWASSGGSTVDTSKTSFGTPGTPVWLQLRRSGTNTYTGYYSTSPTGPWTQVDGTATTSGAYATQDVGMFASSGAAGSPQPATFSSFTVTG